MTSMKASEVDRIIALSSLVDEGVAIDSKVSGETPRQSINRCKTKEEIDAYVEVYKRI